MRNKIIYIIASGHKQAADFARSKSLHPMNWVYLNRVEQCKGLVMPNYIVIGWTKNASDILDELSSRGGIECSDVSVKHEN